MSSKPTAKFIAKATLLIFVSIVFACSLYSRTAQGKKDSSSSLFGLFGGERTVEEPASETSQVQGLAGQACELIFEGDFEKAGELIESTKTSELPASQKEQLPQISQIVQYYEQIEKRRQESREEAYLEQKEKLKEYQVGKVTSDANDLKDVKQEIKELQAGQAPSDVNDVNDSNDLQSILSTIAQASDYATKEQKEKLLSMPFVQKTIKIAKSRAAEFEERGKWLDAYIDCYYWLQEIYQGQEQAEKYSEYAKELREKANVANSFKDDGCESSKGKYDGVSKNAFKRAVDALNFNYVSINIDYQELMLAGIKRCQLLGEVARHSSDKSDVEDGESVCLPKDEKKLTAWSSILDGFRDKINTFSGGMSKDKFTDLFEELLDLNRATAEFPENVLVAQFSEAVLAELDPYTVMIWPKQRENFQKAMTNEFTGIGIEISREKGMLTVASLLPGTPAYRSGLDAGDVIVAVDGKETKNMSMNCAVDYITGPAGTQVTLTIKTPGEEKTHDVVVTRDKITVPTIRGWKRTQEGEWIYMLEDENKIGYVRIMSFSEKTAEDLENVLLRLEEEGLNGLILDLRFNSGGLLSSAIDVSDKFLEQGPIVSTQPRSRFGVLSYASAEKKGTHPDYPMVILINSYSASASEIVAGALGDKRHERAILVGDRTHGKGSVQGITSYPGDGAQLKYTMAYYHLPSGQKVESKKSAKENGENDWGVASDVKVKLRPDELKKMLNTQRDNDVLVQADHENENASFKKRSLEETLNADPQLAIGLLVSKTQLVSRGKSLQN